MLDQLLMAVGIVGLLAPTIMVLHDVHRHPPVRQQTPEPPSTGITRQGVPYVLGAPRDRA